MTGAWDYEKGTLRLFLRTQASDDSYSMITPFREQSKCAGDTGSSKKGVGAHSFHFSMLTPSHQLEGQKLSLNLLRLKLSKQNSVKFSVLSLSTSCRLHINCSLPKSRIPRKHCSIAEEEKKDGKFVFVVPLELVGKLCK